MGNKNQQNTEVLESGKIGQKHKQNQITIQKRLNSKGEEQCSFFKTIPKKTCTVITGSPAVTILKQDILNTCWSEPEYTGDKLIFHSGAQTEKSDYKKRIEEFGTEKECEIEIKIQQEK